MERDVDRGLVLGIDLGTSSVKVLCVGRDDVRCRAGQAYDSPGPEGWWKALTAALHDLSAQCDLSAVMALGLTAQVGTYLLADAAGGVDDTATTGWQAGGGTAQLQSLRARFPASFLREHISMAHPDLVSYPAPQLLRYQEELPDAWVRATRVQQPKDHLYHRMTGVSASDPYSWRGLANLADGTFHDALLAPLGIPASKLPRLYQPSDAPGRLLPRIADELGLSHGLPVHVGCNDFFASLLGMGILGAGQSFDVTGTSEHVGRITQASDTGTHLIHGPFLQDFVHYGVTAASGTSMDWAFRTFGKDASAWSDLDAVFAAHRPAPPLFLPYLRGERAPVFDASARGVFFGLTEAHSPRDLVYSVLEGVVFSLFQIFDSIPEDGVPADGIRVAGGAAFDDGLNRMKACLFQRPFHIMQEKDSGALGAAMHAAVGSGRFESYPDAISAWVRIDHTVYPDLRWQGVLLARSDIYRGLYPALRDSFSAWAAIQGGK